MYDRDYAGRELEFETSGGLLNASLVMRDRQTDSWWSIMSGDAIEGRMKGEHLRELPEAGVKTTWGEWRRKHPDTLVLSVDGKEHDTRNPYDGYFGSNRTFRNLDVGDRRLKPKQPIFSFRYREQPFAVPYDRFEGGAVFNLRGIPDRASAPQVFLYRPPKAKLFASSRAFLVPRGLLEERDGGVWVRAADGAGFRLDGATLERLAAMDGVEPLPGFDTFWYNWVLVNDKTVVLE